MGWATLSKILVQFLWSMLVQVLTGKTMKYLLVQPLKWLAGKTKNVTDDKVVEKLEEDVEGK